MTPEAQRIAIAEACGFTWAAWWDRVTHIVIPLNRSAREDDVQTETFPPRRFLAPAGYELKIGEYECRDMSFAVDDECFRYVPDYLNDLNAMHEAEKVLEHGQRLIYGTCLCSRGDAPSVVDAFFSTAAQRAEALLRTLGKWQETKQEATA